MRTAIKIMLLPIGLWAACSNKQQVRDFIPGTYVNQAQSAYSIASDTLLLIPDEHAGNLYQVVRGTGFQRIRDGKLQPKEYKVKTFSGVWDEAKQILQITQDGSILVFQPDAQTLTVGTAVYHKLK
ncbi:hypothetical protein [Mucilaginibacter ginsenosidivorans]|uniref:Lipoprotein n=1 Tax=Mucilaginibacter ginsenosidivorans TaxID=398053 RepID=A0A5B8UU82_9SPHI|nr:hypothetical protein [Mucilaginibacter ginsenosidivorans]QEC62448.1 hypothetical protein FRZ54_07555 [Mucilaginibacter ginsenosidivorans]